MAWVKGTAEFPLRIPKFPHLWSYGGHHSNICVHHCFHVDVIQLLLRPTGTPSHLSGHYCRWASFHISEPL